MSLETLYASLTGALSGGRITLGPSSQPGGPDVPPGIVPVLAQLDITQLAVTGAEVTLGPAAVLLTGDAQYRNSSWALTLTGESPDGADRLTLRLQGYGAPQTLRSLFGVQPPVKIASQTGALIATDGVLDPLPVANPAFIAATGQSSARMQGQLQITQELLLARYINFLGDRFDLDGTVEFPVTGLPQYTLEGQAPRAKTDWVTAQMVVERSGLTLSNQKVDDNLPRIGLPLGEIDFFAAINQPVRCRLTVPLLRNDSLWPLRFTFDKDSQSLSGGLATIARFLGSSETESYLLLPPGFTLLDAFYISVVELGLDPGLENLSPTLRYSSIKITSKDPWDSPVPFISFKDVGTQWLFRWSEGLTGRQWFVTGAFFGTFVFGKRDGKPGWPLTAYAYLPHFDVWVSSEEPLTIPIGDALGHFNLNPGNLKLELTVAQVGILAQMQDKTLSGYLVVEGDWSIPINRVTFALEQIALRILVSQESVSGSLMALASIQSQTQSGNLTRAVFQVGAEYPGGGNWVFSGGLVEGTLPLLDFIAGFLNLPDPPAWAGSFTLTDLFLRYDTGAPNPYLARGKATQQWDLREALGITLKIEAGGTIERRAAASPTEHALLASRSLLADSDAGVIYAGEFSGGFQVNRFKLSGGLRFDDASKTYFFRVDWDGAYVQAVASDTTTKKSGKHRVITVTLGGVTLGGLLERLIRLVNPNLNYHLEAPWDVLNRIDLSRFSLLFDPTENRIELRFNVNLSLAFVEIDWVGAVCDRSTGEASVYFQLGGRFLGKTYGRGNTDDNPPLTWDAINDPPPAIPGVGEKLIDLRYLGFGQRVTLDNMSQLRSIAATIDALREKLVPPASLDANPLAGQSQLVFSPQSQWLIGLDITVLEFLRVAIVFNDPKMYGLLVELSGPRAGSLDGLSFELLYRKITDDVGMFRVRLKVPDAFRQIELGAFSITLGVITVDIFTNGNFRVDLGFPEKRNFDIAFGFQMGPFIGRGGLYLGVLNGATSERVPAITNGTFSPVIELGIGMAVGVGRTFNKGVLQAGLYVEVEAIFIGVLAWFHPTDAARNTELYYWAQGTAALAGKLYGKVDFKIISVSICVEAYASVTLTVACYQPVVIDLDVGVEVEAEVDLFFFSVSFSFSMNLHASFTVGEARPTPWILAADQTGHLPRQFGRISVPRRRRRASDLVRLTQPAFQATRLATVGNPWNGEQYLFSNQQPVAVSLTLMPVLPIADAAVSWSPQAPGDVPAPSYALAFLLLAAPPGTLNSQSQDVSFDNLVQIFLRWSLNAVGVDPANGVVTPAALSAAATLLDEPETADSGFTLTILDALFSRNLRLGVEGRPVGTSPAAGVAFPMIPNLGWNVSNLPDPNDSTRHFATFRPVDSTYEQEVRDYLNAILPGSHSAATAGTGETESMASFVFRDYCLLIAKSAVQNAQQSIEQASLALSGTDRDQSLAQIARSPRFSAATFPHVKIEGDTIDEVAASLGHSVGELLFWNPDLVASLAAAAVGATVPVSLGVTPQSIAMANGAVALRAVTLVLGDLPYQVRAGDTLGAIANRFGMDLSAWINPTGRPSELLPNQHLLQTGSSLVPGSGYVYANTGALSTTTLAAVFFVRLYGYDDVPFLEWYAQAIVQLTPGIETDPSGDSTRLPATVTVPGSHDGGVASLQWACLPGDTLHDVAAYFALLQNPVPGSAFATFNEAFSTLNPGPTPAQVHLPATVQTVIRPGETLGALATRLLLAADGTVFVGMVGQAPILRALAPVTLLNVTAGVTEGTTLADVASTYGLTLEELGERVQSVPSLLSLSSDPITLAISHPPGMNVNDLAAAVLANDGATQISGQVSRFMMHGLRIPAPVGTAPPYHATGPLTGLYALTGQQVLGRAPPTAGADPTQPLSAQLVVIGDPPAWIAMPGTGIAVSVDDTDLATFGPDATLSPEFADQGQPAPASLVTMQNMRWDLPQLLTWQTQEPVALPGPAPAGVARAMPGLWPLPAALMARAGGPDTTYSLVLLDPGRGPTQTGTPVQRWAWASMVDFTVRRIPGLPGVMEVFGADTAARQTLLNAWREIPSAQAGTVRLLYRMSPANGLPAGLASAVLRDADGGYLIKANLSTETHSGVNVPRRAFLLETETPAYAAPLADAHNFLLLLWECSVVGGGGFWLQMVAPDGSPALPDSVFDSAGNAVLTALITSAAQMASPPSRGLLSFNNCAIVGDAFDAGALSLVVETADPTAVQRLPNVQPGNVAFEMTLLRPPAPNFTDPASDKTNRTRRYYQLAGYGLLQTQVFNGCAPGVPIGPQKLPPATVGARDRWNYRQVIPAARFASGSVLPQTAGLPLPSLDPYAGIQLTGSPADLASVRVQLWFQDMLGNATSGAPSAISPIATAPPPPLPADQIDVPVGYLDAVIGTANWPAATSSFRVPPPAVQASPTLVVDLGFQPAAYTAGPLAAGGAAAGVAADHRDRYARIYFQILRADVEANLLCSLKTGPDGQPVRLPGQIGSLRSYVFAAHAFLYSMAQLDDAIASSVLTSLAQICERYGVWYNGLSAANAMQPLSAIFADASATRASTPKISVPSFAIAHDGETAVDWAGAQAAAVLADDRNTILPLRDSVELAVPVRVAKVPADGGSFADLANDQKCSTSALIAANPGTTSLLAPDFVFDYGGAQVTVDATNDTLNAVALTFRNERGVQVDALTLGMSIADVKAALLPNADFNVASYTAVVGDTFATNQSGATVAALAGANTTTADLFLSGTPVFLGSADGSALFDATLADAARAFGISGEQLLAFNADTPLATDAQVALPGFAAVAGNATDLRIPYQMAGTDSLDLITPRFMALPPQGGVTDPVMLLGLANAELPGTLLPGKQVTVPNPTRSAEAIAGDSFASLAARFSPPAQPGDVVTAIRSTPGCLAAGGILFCPPALVPQTSPASPVAVAGTFHVDPVALAQANAANPDLLKANASVSLMRDGTTVTVIAPEDPLRPGRSAFALNSFVAGFAKQHVTTTLQEIIAANTGADLFYAGAPLVLPPPTVSLSAPLGSDPASLPGPLFALHGWIEIRRTDPRLVLKDFRGTDQDPSPAERSLSPVAPRGAALPNEQPKPYAGALTLDAFVTDIELSLPNLRICSGRVDGAATADVWAVGFGTGLIEKVAVAPPGTPPAPRFFALRPLFNHLVTRQVAVAGLGSDGMLGEPETVSFQGIDTDVWAYEFLQDVELFLAAGNATSAYRGAAQGYLVSIIQHKLALAGAVADGIDYVLGSSVPMPPPPDWSAARESLYQGLLSSLADAWNTDVVLQYDAQASVAAKWAPLSARIAGVAASTDSAADADGKRVTISGAKIDLAKPASYATFGVTLQKPQEQDAAASSEDARQSYLSLDLRYAANEVEFGIHSEEQGYESSNWLSFVHDPATPSVPPGWSIVLGATHAPLPLRNYPSPVRVIAQTAEKTYPQATEWAKAPFWTYALSFQHASAAQDQLRVELTFNKAETLQPQDRMAADDLFSSLAQYATVRSALWSLLKALPDTAEVVADTPLANAIQTFEALVQRVATQWQAHWPTGQRAEWSRLYLGERKRREADGPAAETTSYLLTSTWVDVPGQPIVYQSFVLDRDPASTGPSGWPMIVVAVAGGQGVALDRQNPVGNRCVYNFPAGSSVPVGAELTIVLSVSDLHVARYQNADAEVAVIRNARLLGPDGAQTNDAFVFMTEPVSFANSIVPLLSWGAFDIGVWQAGGGTLANVMSGLLDGQVSGTLSVSFAIDYGYELVPGAEMRTRLPVAFRPLAPYSDTDAAAIANVVQGWRSAQNPSAVNGEWVFAPTLYSNLPGATEKPILQIQQLHSALQAAAGLS